MIVCHDASMIPMRERFRSQIQPVFPEASIALSEYAAALSIPAPPRMAAGVSSVNSDFHVENQLALFGAHFNRLDQTKHSFLFGRLKKRSDIKHNLFSI